MFVEICANLFISNQVLKSIVYAFDVWEVNLLYDSSFYSIELCREQK